ncbi:EF-hand domain-containing protein [Thalassomonas haliotis]|uniref:EF-hand domain-containing protein n=1 Tax=Thalassomonas haliotis TaxID=485448 RepID=A0ABY7VD32_9GAMM|nr:EF-hand domain-containing protein [Thalassomonas haliotis]WDE11302.1 EF-hand domain-containing protein [Thalassomonas haliotis]
MFKLSSKVIICSTLTFMSSLAYSSALEQSQQDKRRGPPPFSQLDLNGDQAISLEEFKQHQIPRGDHETVFANIDSNGDQQISEQELTSHKPPCPPKRKRQE